MGNGTLVDSMIHDGLWCAFEQCHMGMSGEHVAEQFKVGREDQDKYAAESHRKAARATREGWFKDEIVPVEIPQKKGPAARHSIATRRSAKTRRRKRWPGCARRSRRTAASPPATRPGVNDGAAALVVMAAEKARALGVTPMARIVGQATSGLRAEAGADDAGGSGAQGREEDRLESRRTSISSRSTRRSRCRWSPSCASWASSPAKVNVHGGAVALGHPIGASGARVLTTLIYALKRQGKKRGIASLCLGGGNGVALAIELTSA